MFTYHQNDSCIKMGSDESRFNVSLTVRDKVTRKTGHKPQYFEEKEPKRSRTEVLLTSLTPYRWAKPAHRKAKNLIQCCFTSTERLYVHKAY